MVIDRLLTRAEVGRPASENEVRFWALCILAVVMLPDWQGVVAYVLAGVAFIGWLRERPAAEVGR